LSLFKVFADIKDNYFVDGPTVKEIHGGYWLPVNHIGMFELDALHYQTVAQNKDWNEAFF
jgi:hypothetical protein